MAKPSGCTDESTHEFRSVKDTRARPGTHLEVAAVSHPGLCRRKNEDNYLAARLCQSLTIETSSVASIGGVTISPAEGNILIVADGMGGAAGGDRASAIAIERLEAYLREGFRSFLHLGQTDESALFRELKTGIERADLAVFNATKAEPALTGMGTTVVMAYCVDDTVYLLHVGDSRAYLWHTQTLRQITNDHTLVQMMINGGLLSREDARFHARRNVVTNVVGGPEPGLYAEPHKLGLDDGDTLLLCSDGLTEAVDDATIAAILQRDLSAQELADRLVDAALERGGPDNVTVIVAKAHHVA